MFDLYKCTNIQMYRYEPPLTKKIKTKQKKTPEKTKTKKKQKKKKHWVFTESFVYS